MQESQYALSSASAYIIICLVSILVSISVIVFFFWLFSRKERRGLEEQFQIKESYMREQLLELSSLKHENATLKESLAKAHVALDSERRGFEEKIAILENAKRSMGETFRSVSTEVFQANSRQFLELAEQSLLKHHQQANVEIEKRKQEVSNLIKPISDSLKSFDMKVGEIEIARNSAYVGIIEQLKNQQESISKLNLETNSLVKALHSSSTKGSWGEIQLKRVVELAGMLPYCDFVEQEQVEKDGVRFRPDMIIKLPNGKNIVVDSKTPLKAYLESLNITDETQRKIKLLEHSRQMRSHVQILGSKNYWEQFQPSPEFVVLFLPGETFFNAAMENDPSLIEFGVDKRVIISTPSSLIALLKAIAYGWKQEQLAVNAQQVRELGQSLHERLLTLAKYFVDLKRGLDAAVSAYNKAIGAMENRVLVSARKFQELGAASGNVIPQLNTVESAPRELIRLFDDNE